MVKLNLSNLDEVVLNAPMSVFGNVELHLKDFIINVCTQVDQNLVYVVLGILSMYLIKNYVTGHLKSFIPNKKFKIPDIKQIFKSDTYHDDVKTIEKKDLFLYDIFNSIDNITENVGLMCAIYLLWIVYLQIGFTTGVSIVVTIFIAILIIGNILNFLTWRRKR